MRSLKHLFTNPRLLIVFAMGFSSGLPLLLTGSTLSAWMRIEGVSLTAIGAFSVVSISYTFKFVWAPFLDRFVPPFLGRRRGWLFITQVFLGLAIFALSLASPKENIMAVVVIAGVISFLSASQDIVIDAYRREVLLPEEFGFGTSLAITAYRLGMLYSSSFAFILVGPEIGMSWENAYRVMAGGMLIGLLTTLLAPEPQVEVAPPKSLRSAFLDPFIDYFSRPGAYWMLAFIVLYKIGDLMASQMLVPFYLDLKFTTTEIGTLGKLFGIWSTIFGGLVGGAVMVKLGLKRSLWVFGVLQSVSNLSFVWLANVGNNQAALATAISVESFTLGMGSAAVSALMAALTNKKFTATQFALLSSLMSLPRIAIGPPAGFIADRVSWTTFFIICALAAIPGMLILLKIGKWADQAEREQLPTNTVSGSVTSNR